MARIRYRLSYSDTRAELVDHKDQKRGASEDAFWDEDELIDHRPKRGKKTKAKNRCPETENGRHVWVWVDWVWSVYHLPKYEEKVCCGCLKKSYGRKSFRIKK